VPSPLNPPGGCRFHPRCPDVMQEICPLREPSLIEHSPGHWVSCWLYEAH
jgi:oligopeptide/dipeptide ABC transporter ATP-binding protein